MNIGADGGFSEGAEYSLMQDADELPIAFVIAHAAERGIQAGKQFLDISSGCLELTTELCSGLISQAIPSDSLKCGDHTAPNEGELLRIVGTLMIVSQP